MPRGVRKTELEKLKEELAEVQAAIKQYGDALANMKEREKEISEKIHMEEFKAFQAMMKQQGLTMEDIWEAAENIGKNQCRTA